jgi:hypothetical protein
MGDRRHRGFARRTREFGGARAAGREGHSQGAADEAPSRTYQYDDRGLKPVEASGFSRL